MVASLPWTEPYWTAVEEGRLLYQECDSCNRAIFPPRQLCPACAGSGLEWRESAGKGSIYSVTVVTKGALPEFEHDMPYAVGIVDLDEGFRMVSRFLGDKPHELECDQSVRLVFSRVGDRDTLPCFEPEGS